MNKRWKLKPANLNLQKEIAQSLQIPMALAQILINRGISCAKAAKDFLYCERSVLHDPFLLKGMAPAVQRIKKAIACGEKIMVWGDYDVDGITSCALLTSVLRERQAKDVLHYLPNRLEEGYGLNETGTSWARENGVGLLITVDCGISAAKHISDLKKAGIDTIVTDHHHPADGSFPESAWAVVNPLQKDCAYPYKYLAGVGVAAKLAAALTGEPERILNKYLDIITLGTVGDVVPLTGENRTLVKRGLKTFSATRNIGLKALMDVAGIGKKEITARHIGYALGPRINASGRLGAADDSYNLLFADCEDTAYALAKKLDGKNRLRQRIEQGILQEAMARVESGINFKEHSIIVLGAPHWHQGVMGIVASRLVERYFRPAIMLSLRELSWHGSGRSIGNFHLLEAVSRCKDILEAYGGHRRACGIRLGKDKFSDFFEAINRVAREMLLPEDIIPVLEIDAQMPLAHLTMDFIKKLQLLAPFGTDNPQPVICSCGLKVKAPASVISGSHVKFWVSDGSRTCEAIAFNKAGTLPCLSGGEIVDVVYTPSINTWQENVSIQLEVMDVKISSGPLS